MTNGYVRVQTIHPDWKDGECRKCGKHLKDRIHKDVQRGRDVATTTCRECNYAYDPLEMNTIGRGPSVPEIAVNSGGVTERL